MAEKGKSPIPSGSEHHLKSKLPIIENDPSTSTSMYRQQSSQIDGGGERGQVKIGHRRVDLDGKVTYKKKPTSELMAAIQLGIGQSITSMACKPKRDLLLQDFAMVETVHFPKEGSSQSPAHEYTDFRFRTYAPVAFRYFKELFGIHMDAFLVSVCNNPLKELSNPGASGSIFYLTDDDEFIIKTVQHKEAEFLQKLLPGYYMNLNQNPRTLLPKFYGLYCYQCAGKNIRLVVMNNLLPSSVRLHEKYDLKGSTYKRKASQAELSKLSPTLKDLDFRELHPDGLMLEAETYTALLKTVDRDVRVLQSFQIMDYSMLLAVHNIDQAIREKSQMAADADTPEFGEKHDTHSPAEVHELVRGRSTHTRLAHFSTAMEAIQARSDPLEIDEDSVPPGGLPARNTKGERLLLYIGIIDILQNYRVSKKLEHAMKSVVYDGDSISVHRPGFYSQRFLDFFSKTVFQKIPSLDEPKGKGTRFKKLVQIVRIVTDHTLKSKSASTEQESESEVQKRSISEPGPKRDRPDVLPETTPPQTLTSGSQNSLHAVYKQLVAQSAAVPSQSEEHLSSVHSYTLSTPTHTDFTEGLPSYTASSPSVSSDVLGTPARHSTADGDNVPAHVTEVTVDNDDVILQLPVDGSAYFVPQAESTVRSSVTANQSSVTSSSSAELQTTRSSTTQQFDSSTM